MQHATPDKPEVMKMATRLGMEPEQATGHLVRVWIWVDQQSLNGHALDVTDSDIDRIARHAGVASAMREVGWMTGKSGALSFPHFERHNGESAKKRALATDRKRDERSRVQRDESVTREEKRRDNPIVPPTFAQFWSSYPRKEAKQKAIKAFESLHLVNGDFEKVMQALEVAKKSEQWTRDGGKFIPHPATWLNGRRFDDEGIARVEKPWTP